MNYASICCLGEKGLPLVGSLYLFSPKDKGKPLEEMHFMKLCDKYVGNFKVKILGK